MGRYQSRTSGCTPSSLPVCERAMHVWNTWNISTKYGWWWNSSRNTREKLEIYFPEISCIYFLDLGYFKYQYITIHSFQILSKSCVSAAFSPHTITIIFLTIFNLLSFCWNCSCFSSKWSSASPWNQILPLCFLLSAAFDTRDRCTILDQLESFDYNVFPMITLHQWWIT